ncbi:hypothetical protein RFI_17818 [Reticulomyxa filosa]|uniref:Uncharacterized protein n=1 Tax=Reticulomyxa filosa TaxID=46433 RepID=X6N044_RETFI|nr:hypothetical protein RFI_17818 [Reticulomyxa filosa]|eukprot:ETO19406.1 hypothetical protein RFI_17818 [Reticulomyxa filosa]
MNVPENLNKQTSEWAVKEMANIFELLDLDEKGKNIQTIYIDKKQNKIKQMDKRAENGYVDKDSFVTWLRNDKNIQEVEDFRQKIRKGLQHLEVDPNAEVDELQIAYEISDKNAKQMEEDEVDISFLFYYYKIKQSENK